MRTQKIYSCNEHNTWKEGIDHLNRFIKIIQWNSRQYSNITQGDERYYQKTAMEMAQWVKHCLVHVCTSGSRSPETRENWMQGCISVTPVLLLQSGVQRWGRGGGSPESHQSVSLEKRIKGHLKQGERSQLTLKALPWPPYMCPGKCMPTPNIYMNLKKKKKLNK